MKGRDEAAGWDSRRLNIKRKINPKPAFFSRLRSSVSSHHSPPGRSQRACADTFKEHGCRLFYFGWSFQFQAFIKPVCSFLEVVGSAVKKAQEIKSISFQFVISGFLANGCFFKFSCGCKKHVPETCTIFLKRRFCIHIPGISVPEQKFQVFRIQGKSPPERLKSIFTDLFLKLYSAFQVS